MRYIWSTFLLISAVLAPDAATALILVISGIITLLLAFSREQKVARLAAELSDILAIKRKSDSIALERSLGKEQRDMLALALVSLTIIFTALLFGWLDITVARHFALLVLVALAPLGLEIALAGLLRNKQKRGSETVRTAIGYAIEDARTLLVVIALSFIGTVWLAIPPALSALQVLFIIGVARPLLSGRALQALPNKADQAWRVGTTAFVVYGSYIFFYIRHYLEPQFADQTNVQVLQATTMTFLVFVACQAWLIFLEAKKLPTKRLLVLLGGLIAVVSVPAIESLFRTYSLATDDWLWVILAASTYGAVHILRLRYKRVI